MIDLPQPLTPADCNLRDFQFMPMDVARLLTSETWVLGSGDERAAAMTLWLESWRQVPASSLPMDERMLAHLSQSKVWKKVRTHALRGWIQATDGRLYHPVVAEKVLEAWIEKLAFSHSGSSGNAKRWGIEIETAGIRARVIAACDMLRALAPQSKTLKKKAVLLIVMGSPPDKNGSPPESPPDLFEPSPPDSPGDRKGQGQGQGQGLLTSKAEDSGGGTVPDHEDPPRVAPPLPMREDPPLSDDPAVRMSVMLRRLGVDALFTHPAVQAWVAQGVTDEIIAAAVAKARIRKGDAEIPANYLVGIIDDLLNPPALAATSGRKNGPGAWQASAKGIERKGKAVGLTQHPDELHRDYAARIQTELENRKGQS